MFHSHPHGRGFPTICSLGKAQATDHEETQQQPHTAHRPAGTSPDPASSTVTAACHAGAEASEGSQLPSITSHRIIETGSIPSWKGPTGITEPNPRPHAAPPAPVCESGVPALPELRHRGRAHCPGQPVPCPPPSGAQPFPQPHPPSPDTAPCRSLGPRRCHRQQSSALPSAPCESCGRHRASPQLLCSELGKRRGSNAIWLLQGLSVCPEPSLLLAGPSWPFSVT